MYKYESDKMTEKFSHEKLVDWLIEYYTYEFVDLELADKINKINYVIQNNAQIFSPEYISHFTCAKCGWCCRQMKGCVYFDEENRLCTRHDDLPYTICDTYPWGGEYGLVLSINCLKLQKALIFYFDYIFQQMEDAQHEN